MNLESLEKEQTKQEKKKKRSDLNANKMNTRRNSPSIIVFELQNGIMTVLLYQKSLLEE